MAPLLASGRQFALRHGALAAVVTDVGATLRRFRAGDDEVLAGFAEDEISPDGRGQVLAPWPNRLGDGRYRVGDLEAVVPMNEPEKRNAIHGLVRWMTFAVEESGESFVSLALVVPAQPAYPFAVRLTVTYRLSDAGLRVEFGVENLGKAPAPFGIGFHPYLECGPGGVDGARLALDARERLVLDGRGLPVGRAPLAASAYARLSSGDAPIGDLVLDDCLTGLGRRDGVARARLSRRDGREVEIFLEEPFSYLMCFSGDTLSRARRRRSLALEPMTCPPDALRSGTDLLMVDPGGRAGGAWGISPLS